MVYALSGIKTNILITEYESREEALTLVLLGIERNGPGDTASRALESEDDQREVTVIAHGRELAALAQHELGGTGRLGR